MATQRLHCVIGPGQFGLRERGVNFVVANLVQQNRRPALAAAKLGHKVVQALAGIRRNRPIAQGANRYVH